MKGKPIPVVAIFDVGKTNKKLFLFNEQYQIVFERSARFLETVDEDGDHCENLESLRLSVFDSLHEVFRKGEFEIKAINFTSYGASFVYIDKDGRPLTPLYNYLKEYPKKLLESFYAQYGGKDKFALETSSPSLGSLNSGLQVYRLSKLKPAIFKEVKWALHLPQYLSYLISGQAYSDMTSIGCHTALWDFSKNNYHRWVEDTGIIDKMAPIVQGDRLYRATFPGSGYLVGSGLHDSSSALIPYLLNFHEPFILISTGTWCISFNPFNIDPLTKEELHSDCLLYMTYTGKPVKASRLFAGYEHEEQIKRIAKAFQISTGKFKQIDLDWTIIEKYQALDISDELSAFSTIDLSHFSDYIEAYHVLMMHLVKAQVKATTLVMNQTGVQRIFVDGGFSRNHIYMGLLAQAFPNSEVFGASMAQATALGAALVIHDHWNSREIPNDIIELRYFRTKQQTH
ncbi:MULTISPECIES: FGGY-family carbohydrate kinase [Sphingobacterium]|uniref:Carbohydrate kinase n=1 Tax=Sphingobacterium athyrii TaxID=2152717 RepID=A0A363NS33_9SPHI|nr:MULTISPECIES: FGGY family carbohydrate kinase [Sphingobacterium]PUV23584.1 carbohydrate kinase [Sphingobacterium athyrii]QIH36392.1 carbohydrate kinase [Sphingobacterium sp. DR205]